MANGQSVDRSERLGLVVLVVTDLDWVDFELAVADAEPGNRDRESDHVWRPV